MTELLWLASATMKQASPGRRRRARHFDAASGVDVAGAIPGPRAPRPGARLGHRPHRRWQRLLVRVLTLGPGHPRVPITRWAHRRWCPPPSLTICSLNWWWRRIFTTSWRLESAVRWVEAIYTPLFFFAPFSFSTQNYTIFSPLLLLFFTQLHMKALIFLKNAYHSLILRLVTISPFNFQLILLAKFYFWVDQFDGKALSFILEVLFTQLIKERPKFEGSTSSTYSKVVFYPLI